MAFESIMGAAGGTVFAIAIAWVLLKEFFKNTNAWRDSDKSSRITIDNHIDHLTNAVNSMQKINARALEHMEEMHVESKESRRNLIETLQKSTEASTMQTMTNKQMIKTIENLTEVVQDKL